MPPASVQGVRSTAADDTSPFTLAYTGNVTAGNLGYAGMFENLDETSTLNTPTDTVGSVWALILGFPWRDSRGSTNSSWAWWTIFPASGANTFSVTPLSGSPTGNRLGIAEFSAGVGATWGSSPLVASSIGTEQSGTTEQTSGSAAGSGSWLTIGSWHSTSSRTLTPSGAAVNLTTGGTTRTTILYTVNGTTQAGTPDASAVSIWHNFAFQVTPSGGVGRPESGRPYWFSPGSPLVGIRP